MFEMIKGNKDAKSYFTNAIQKNHLAHSYIFTGPSGTGKKLLAYELTRMLACQDEQKPCGHCNSCNMSAVKGHPDIKWIAKDGKTTKIDSIRSVIAEMATMPYAAPYKFVIVEAADTMTVEAQNTLLKTLEEPPSFGILILCVENISKLLPTILSRCVTIRFNPLSKAETLQFLDEKGVTSPYKEIYAKQSAGCLGEIEEMINDENYLALRTMSLNMIQQLSEGSLVEVYDLLKTLIDTKNDCPRILAFWLQWFRDMTLLKTTEQCEDLFFSDNLLLLKQMSALFSLKQLGSILDRISEALIDLKNNINASFVLEQLLLGISPKPL